MYVDECVEPWLLASTRVPPPADRYAHDGPRALQRRELTTRMFLSADVGPNHLCINIKGNIFKYRTRNTLEVGGSKGPATRSPRERDLGRISIKIDGFGIMS